MTFIILILSVIICCLVFRIFTVKKELKRIADTIEDIKSDDSNMLIHQEISMKELSLVISEINLLLKASKEAAADFESKGRNLRKMMTNISHDLRTPLTSALGYIDMIIYSDILPEEKIRELKIVEERLERLRELIDSFFEFSKAVSSDKLPEFTEVNIISVIEECIVHFYEDFEKDGRRIILDSHVSRYKTDSSREMLIRIFDNLIGNAYRHSTKDLTIQIENSDGLRIVFINELPYPDLDMDHIFDEFYTVDISRTQGNTGLGLAIAKEFVEMLGGSITARKSERDLNMTIEFKN